MLDTRLNGLFIDVGVGLRAILSLPFLSKIADFLLWLRRSRRLSVSAVMGYRSMLSAVFKSILPEISTSPTLHDLLRSFQVEAPVREVRPPSWDLPTVLNFLRSSPFEPLSSASLRDLTRKTVFNCFGYCKESR